MSAVTLESERLVVVVISDAIFQAECLCQQTLRIKCAGALDGIELFTIEGSEKWRSTPNDLEESENAVFQGKTLSTAIAAIR